MSANNREIFSADKLRRLQIIRVPGENRIALIDPREKVDGEPIEHLSFDLNEDRSLGDFLEIVLGPSLIASGMTLAEFLSHAPNGFNPEDRQAS